MKAIAIDFRSLHVKLSMVARTLVAWRWHVKQNPSYFLTDVRFARFTDAAMDVVGIDGRVYGLLYFVCREKVFIQKLGYRLQYIVDYTIRPYIFNSLVYIPGSTYKSFTDHNSFTHSNTFPGSTLLT